MVCKLCLDQLSLEMQAKRRGTCQNVNHDKVREFCKQCIDSNQIVLPLLPSTATCCQVWWWIFFCQRKACSPQVGSVPTPVWLSFWWRLQICSRASWAAALERCDPGHVQAFLHACLYLYVHVHILLWGGVCEGVTLIYIAIYSPCLLDALGGMIRLHGMRWMLSTCMWQYCNARWNCVA